MTTPTIEECDEQQKLIGCLGAALAKLDNLVRYAYQQDYEEQGPPRLLTEAWIALDTIRAQLQAAQEMAKALESARTVWGRPGYIEQALAAWRKVGGK